MKIIDFHIHLGKSIFGYGQNIDFLLRNLDRLQIEKSVIIPVHPPAYHLPPQNNLIAKSVSKHPDRLFGFCRIDPRLGKPAEIELRRCIKDLGLNGLFLHPWEETCPVNSSWTRAVLTVAQELKIPVMIAGGHVRVSMACQIADLAKDFSDIPMIVTSGGQINISGIALNDAKQLLIEFPNLILETSGIYREDFIEDMVPLIGSNRMVFGSNAPEYCQELELMRPQLAHLAPEHKENILANTANRLLMR